MSAIKKIAIMCSGGDCAGMNPAIKQFVEYSISRGVQPYGVKMGFTGLYEGQISPLNYGDVSGIVHLGGTVLGSSRFPKMHEAHVRAEMASRLNSAGIDSLIVLGGNGSFKGLELLNKEFGLSVVGIPATIDNDVFGSETALGVDTASNVIRHCLDQIRDTASSFHRAFIVETMGRDCGYLALVTALTSGAEVCLVPEIDFSLLKIESRLKAQLSTGRKYIIGIVSEGVPDGSNQLKEMIETKLEMTCRITVLGHIQRGGSPTVKDRLHGFETVTIAINELLNGNKGFAVLCEQGRWRSRALHEIEPKIIGIPNSLLSMAERLGN